MWRVLVLLLLMGLLSACSVLCDPEPVRTRTVYHTVMLCPDGSVAMRVSSGGGMWMARSWRGGALRCLLMGNNVSRGNTLTGCFLVYAGEGVRGAGR